MFIDIRYLIIKSTYLIWIKFFKYQYGITATFTPSKRIMRQQNIRNIGPLYLQFILLHKKKKLIDNKKITQLFGDIFV